MLELAPLRDVASAALPLLDQHAETQPYAAWLRTRLDYLAVADTLKFAIPPPNLELPPSANPTPTAERRAWEKRLQLEDLPPEASVYVAQLKPIFVAEGVPPELVWLAEVESGFDTLARSPIGAMGLFQLMPDTARNPSGCLCCLGDQRHQFEKNGRAAAKFLKEPLCRISRLAVDPCRVQRRGGTVYRTFLMKYGAHSYDEMRPIFPPKPNNVPKVEATIQRREGVTLENLKLPSRNANGRLINTMIRGA